MLFVAGIIILGVILALKDKRNLAQIIQNIISKK